MPSRFSQASGVDLQLSRNGLKVQTSLLYLDRRDRIRDTPHGPVLPAEMRIITTLCQPGSGLRAAASQPADLRAHLQRIRTRYRVNANGPASQFYPGRATEIDFHRAERDNSLARRREETAVQFVEE